MGPVSNGPHPILGLAHRHQSNALLRPEAHLAIRATDAHVLTVAEEGDGTRIEAQVLVLLQLLPAGEVIEGEGLIPAPDGQYVMLLLLGRIPGHGPYGSRAQNGHHLLCHLVPYANLTVHVPQGKVLTVVRPGAAQYLGCDLGVAHFLLQRIPHTKVGLCTTDQLMGHRVERQTLYRIVVIDSELTLALAGPNDDALVSGPRRESLPVLTVGHTVHVALVGLQFFDEFSRDGIVHEDATAGGHNNLKTVGRVGQAVDDGWFAILVDLGFGVLVYRCWSVGVLDAPYFIINVFMNPIGEMGVSNERVIFVSRSYMHHPVQVKSSMMIRIQMNDVKIVNNNKQKANMVR